MKILVTPTSMQPQEGKVNPALEKLREFADELVFNPTGKPLTGEMLIQQLQGCDGYLAGLDSISADVLEHCPNLKAISRYGVGYDRVDLAAAEKQGYCLRDWQGYIAVFEDGRQTPKTVTDIPTETLNNVDREKLKTGIEAETREELLSLLEDLSS